MSIGSRIREAREAKNVTLETLGAACGTTKQTIYKYENGIVTNIPMDKVECIAKYLNISPAYIMGWENESGETDIGLSAIDIAQWIDASPVEVSEVMEKMTFPNGIDLQALARIAAEVKKRNPTPVSESGRRINIVKIAGRDGSYMEKRLTDEQIKALQTIVNHMPEAPEDL